MDNDKTTTTTNQTTITTTRTVEFPLKPWQKMILNVAIVSGITTVSIISAGGMNDVEIWKSAILAGVMTFLIQMKVLMEKDLQGDDKGASYTPLMFVK